MENKEIIDRLKLNASLLELHEANDFKIRGYQSAAFNLDRINERLADMSEGDLSQIQSVSKNMAIKIREIVDTGSFEELNEMLKSTPSGVIEMLDIKGIGAKKIKFLWKNEGIETRKDLLKACMDNKIAGLKGFGEKTQENIKQSILFTQSQVGRYLYAEVEGLAEDLTEKLSAIKEFDQVSISGQVRRKMEIVDCLQFVASTNSISKSVSALDQLDFLSPEKKQSGPFVWRGNVSEQELKMEVHFTDKANFGSLLYKLSSGEGHLSRGIGESTVLRTLETKAFPDEAAVAKELSINVVEPEVREGFLEFNEDFGDRQKNLLKSEDIKGVIHSHSTWSDGKKTIEEMALACKERGYEYLGMTDHSVTAFYANGLDDDRVEQQQREIDELNKKLDGFTIFKGIESDILNDGALDYDEDVLKSFDFIIASIHSNLNMDYDKAMMRLIKAIENPYTTILGHMTGRLLLRREGYPVNHKKIIDACAANNVMIEINANPRRLDIDWRHVAYCIEKGVMLAICPDSHDIPGIDDIPYGVHIGRKGGLTAAETLNTRSAKEVAEIFKKKNG